MRQKEDFTDADIADFATLCQQMGENWISLAGSKGMTNYFHLIISGHVTYFLKMWKNLYRYSQQGWEAVNSLIQSYFFRRTQMGGYNGSKTKAQSKLESIGDYLQRVFYWRSKKADDLFKDK